MPDTFIPRTKYKLPIVYKFKNIKFDIKSILNDLFEFQKEWQTIYEANRGLCAAHEELAAGNYTNFKQIGLTSCKPTESLADLETLREECKILSRSYGKSKSSYKLKTRDRDKLPDPELNEHNWDQPLPFYEGSYTQKAIAENFKSKAIRVRFTKIESGAKLTPHIDYDPTYAVRIIVPLITDSKIVNVFWKRGEMIRETLEADGSAYFLNTGFKHSVENNSNIDRIALMFSLADQRDLTEIK